MALYGLEAACFEDGGYGLAYTLLYIFNELTSGQVDKLVGNLTLLSVPCFYGDSVRKRKSAESACLR